MMAMDLVERIGPVAAEEFAAAPEYAKAELLNWVEALATLSDEDFYTECCRAIYDSAQANRFRGNWNHDHCRGSACYHESVRRLVRDGHDEDCRGPSIYSRAHAQLMRENGYKPTPDGECRCVLAARSEVGLA